MSCEEERRSRLFSWTPRTSTSHHEQTLMFIYEQTKYQYPCANVTVAALPDPEDTSTTAPAPQHHPTTAPLHHCCTTARTAINPTPLHTLAWDPIMHPHPTRSHHASITVCSSSPQELRAALEVDGTGRTCRRWQRERERQR